MFTLMTSLEGPVRRRPPFFKTSKLGLIGCTESVVHTPWHDPSWTLAAHASARQHCKREPDWWFDLHRRACFTQKKAWNRRYWEWLTTTTTPIFMQEAYADIPAAVKYPKARILAEFRPYFTNHVAWMIALAMTEGVKTIGLFGCQYKCDTEYGIQRGSCEYWLGRFEQYGGTLVLPGPRQTLLNKPSKLYGYESHDADGKLIAEYRAQTAAVAKTDAHGHAAMAPLTILEPSAAPPRHLDIGEPVAWERSGFAIPELVAP
jgi:hypothetical protein